MTMLRTAAAIAAVLSFVSPAEAEPLKPTGNWVINYAEAQCLATRPFGTKDAPLHLLIKPSPTSDVIQIAVASDGSSMSGMQRQGSIRFGTFDAQDVKVLEYGTSEKKNVKSLNLSQELATQLGQSSSIRWEVRGKVIELDTGPMKEVVKVMANCRDDLRDYWNIEESKSAVLRSPVSPSQPLIRYFSVDDYPAQAISQREGGMTSVVLLVDEKGVIQDCMVDGTSGIATLDAMTCIVLRKKGKFEPATDSQGKPTKGAFKQRVRWEVAN